MAAPEEGHVARGPALELTAFERGDDRLGIAALCLVGRLGERAGVKNVHPHRFRHTFATEYLRNHGQMLALKDLLGHSDFEMVEHYAHFVAADVQHDHENASPVDNWKV